MAHALRLAEQGLFSTSPNPRVGCVLVKADTLVGTGWHQRAGEPHAEALALAAAGSAAYGCTAYVTLEPCSHFGRTPPCADALIAAGVARVVVAMQDPNPLVSGQGIAKLRAAGIAVEVGLMEADALALNIGFVKRMRDGLPWLRSKIAASLDGRTALANGVSQWITGAEARRDGHLWRARSCAVLTGIDTILADDAELSVRHVETPRQPLRVVLDSQLRIPTSAKILHSGNVLIFTASTEKNKIESLQALGAQVVTLPDVQGHVDLLACLRYLAKTGCNEVLLEAGRTLNGAFFNAGLVDELLLYLAPQLLGDSARGMANILEITQLNQGVALDLKDVRLVGKDLRICANIQKIGQ
jgi:diaminohydroxyphosphoribosylaminopyrimidine deaminase/5-amino-6-(5-phosphoribosylamino)uracil reductase